MERITENMNEDKVILPNGHRRMMFSFGKKKSAFKFWQAILNKQIQAHTYMLIYPVVVEFDDNDEIAGKLQRLFMIYFGTGKNVKEK